MGGVTKINWLEPRLHERFAGRPAMLDVGCGAGMFLYKFMQRFPGWYAAGVEPGKIFGHTAARHLSSPIANRNYEPGIFGRRFELITLDSGAGACRKPRDAARGCEGRSCSGRARLYRDAQRRRFRGGAAGPRPFHGASSVLFFAQLHAQPVRPCRFCGVGVWSVANPPQ